MLELGYRPCSNILIVVVKYLGASGPVVNFPNVDKEITILAININLNSYIENMENIKL